MSDLRRWHPWRRRLYGWVTAWAERRLKPPPEPKVYRAEGEAGESELRRRLRRGVARDLGVNA